MSVNTSYMIDKLPRHKHSQMHYECLTKMSNQFRILYTHSTRSCSNTSRRGSSYTRSSRTHSCAVQQRMPNTVRRSARCTRRRRCSSSATRFLHQPASSQDTSCRSGCPPATTALAHTRDTSRCRSPRNSRSTVQASSSNTPCDPADCCTCRDHRSGRCTSPQHAHTRSCSSSMPARHSPPPTARSPGTPRTMTPPTHRKKC